MTNENMVSDKDLMIDDLGHQIGRLTIDSVAWKARAQILEVKLNAANAVLAENGWLTPEGEDLIEATTVDPDGESVEEPLSEA